jgi:hypothetical protein
VCFTYLSKCVLLISLFVVRLREKELTTDLTQNKKDPSIKPLDEEKEGRGGEEEEGSHHHQEKCHRCHSSVKVAHHKFITKRK